MDKIGAAPSLRGWGFEGSEKSLLLQNEIRVASAQGF